jgi:hypothetical protein
MKPRPFLFVQPQYSGRKRPVSRSYFLHCRLFRSLFHCVFWSVVDLSSWESSFLANLALTHRPALL